MNERDIQRAVERALQNTFRKEELEKQRQKEWQRKKKMLKIFAKGFLILLAMAVIISIIENIVNVLTGENSSLPVSANTEREITEFIGKPCSYVLDDYGIDYIVVSDGISGEFYYETGCPYAFGYAETDFSADNIIIAVASEEKNAYIVKEVQIGMELSEVEEALDMTFDSANEKLVWACCREGAGEYT